MDSRKDKERKLPTSTVIGAVALVFLIIGYQTALFVHKAATLKIVSDRDCPDTVYIIERITPAPGGEEEHSVSSSVHKAPHSPAAEKVRRQSAPRRHESFRFNPNTVSVEDLMRLGFTLKQAESIENYRAKGGRFRRKSDFAKSYVVSDSIFRRLEPYIDIPLVDINTADSAAFDALPGIGPWFAARMVSFRKELHGYSCKEQLLDIYNFGQERYNGLQDLITVSPAEPYPLWSLPEDSLRLHPFIDRHAAHAIVLFRENSPAEDLTVDALAAAGILTPEAAAKLSRCRLK